MGLLLRLLLALAASLALPAWASSLPAPSSSAPKTASGASAASVDEEHTYFVGELGAWVHNASGPIDVNGIGADPGSLWGHSADDIATAFNNAGYKASVRQSTKGSMKAQIVSIEGHSSVMQVQVHPGGGRHGGAYVKVSTSTDGVVKVIDPETYVATPGEKARIVPKKGCL